MKPNPPHRDLLLADLAVAMGIVSARDVAFALQRFWEGRQADRSILDGLREVARLTDEDVARLTAEAARLIGEAEGDPRLALGARGGVDRSIHVELSRNAAPIVDEILAEGGGARSPLRPVAEDRYLGFQEIGRGGMGVVYLAIDTELNRRVAMKVVRADRGSDRPVSPLSLEPPERDTPASQAFRLLTARFLQEAWVTGGLEHPGIVPVYELGQTPAGVPYYTMRFVKGERTLESAIDRADTHEDRLGLLEPFLRVCDTMAYAHSRGVIHRDLKPANIALGEFGEVVILDWGLAKVRERPDLSRTTWKDRIEEIRETEDLKTLAGGMGTPGYMSPESVVEKAGRIDARGDVYSLGAILYRILTGRLPHSFESFREFTAKLLTEDPIAPHDLDPAIPDVLSRICTKALAREKDERPPSVREFAASIRRWRRESAVDREVEGLLHEARTAWEGADGLTGEVLLRQIDRVLGHAGRALEIRPGEPDAEGLVALATEARTRALAERDRSVRKRLIRRAALVGLVLALAAAGAVASAVESRRRQAVAAEGRANEEKDAKDRALTEVLRLADSKEVRDLLNRADTLWPIHPDRAKKMATWITRAEEFLEGRAAHEAALNRIRESGGPDFTDPVDAWQHDVLEDLAKGHRKLADGDGSLLARVVARYELAKGLEASSIEERRDEWDRTIARIADVAANPAYRGLRIEPVLGLVPLGKDPESGLFEFAHLGSGSLPRRSRETGRLAFEEGSAIVLVLIPRGRFLMGAQKTDPSGPNYDPWAETNEVPVHEVTLGPYLIAKHECTIAQWAAMTEGNRPSRIPTGTVVDERKVTGRNPVGNVTWTEVKRWLDRHRLRLPSEAEWEHSCRAGTATAWHSGMEISALGEFANIADAYGKRVRGPGAWEHSPEVDDGHLVHAAVGSYRANAFGLHDMHGNLWEWCEDPYDHDSYVGAPTDGSPRGGRNDGWMRVRRGGSWVEDARRSRSAARRLMVPSHRTGSLGFRAALSLPSSEGGRK